MNLKFFFALLPCLLPCLSYADAYETEDTSVRFQITYNEQRHPGFNQARASSANNWSLTNGRDHMFTLTATPHLGMRLWTGGEIYINVEEAGGVPFTDNLVGLGGFTNGEITRTAGAHPKAYLQRLFVRQTWGLGGGTEKIESDFNQMASLVDKNRLVLTVGNFSLLDVFDDNAYAKDPRTQFMNWSNWTYAAYDYAADARGFGWGATIEWIQGDWAFRYGRMTGPKEPNGLPIDFSIFKHYGDQVEVARGYRLGDQPGKLRVLAWRNRAVMAKFSDALAHYKNNSSDAQAILYVRNSEQIKHGVGINFDQAISNNIGAFLRMMKADGKTETLAFTEVDASVSTGIVFNGLLWRRPQDSIGVALARNYLSKDRREYLESGAISFFIGDGYLNYRPETILETFYSLGIFKGTWVTADYQRIQNPAYNADRGPVNVYALRLHVEF